MTECNFCQKKSLYTCPQCNVPFCSSDCYKSTQHLRCSESFYKGLVEEQLKGSLASEESKRKMQEILHRSHTEEGEDIDEEDLLDSDDDEDLSERMAGIDLNNTEAVWSKLTENERSEFLKLINSGHPSEVIPTWEPWWDRCSSLKLVVVDETSTEDDRTSKDAPAFVSICPPHVDCLPLSCLTKNKPSPCIPFNIINVLASYVWIVRLFNGDHLESPLDATEGVFSLCPVLGSAANYSSSEIAVETPILLSQDFSWLRQDSSFASDVRRGVVTLLQGPNKTFRSYFVVSALSDVHKLLHECKRDLKSQKQKGTVDGSSVFLTSIGRSNREIPLKITTKEIIRKSMKKLEFFIAFIKKFPERICIDL